MYARILAIPTATVTLANSLFFLAVVALFSLTASRYWLASEGPSTISHSRSFRSRSLEAPSQLFDLESGFFIAQAIVSAVLLAAALFVILTKRYESRDKQWAYGTIAMIVGFWLKV